MGQIAEYERRPLRGQAKTHRIHRGMVGGNRREQNVPTNSKLGIVAWPEAPRAEAYYGVAGEIVRALDPHTESDPIALLGQILVAFGNVIGRTAYFPVEADRHYPNLFMVLVGQTSKSRKGTSTGHVRRRFADIDRVWEKECLKSGLSSGEGLVWAVRDPVERREPVKQKGHFTGYGTVLADDGVADKRLLVLEPEFAQPLKLMTREGNILSTVIRSAWDNGDLRIMTKNVPATATGGHISIIGHISREELLRHLNLTEQANGFANRFLWLCVKRSKLLPEGGLLNEANLLPLQTKLGAAVHFAQGVGEMKRDDEARETWCAVYGELSEGKPGLAGCLTSRAEAQVTRLSCIYALLDRSPVVRKPHLLAALAFWEYAESSARFIFGDSIGYAMADELLCGIRSSPNGLSRTQINELFGRNKSAREIERALTMLAEYGLVGVVNEQTAGRPTQRWSTLNSGTKQTKLTK